MLVVFVYVSIKIIYKLIISFKKIYLIFQEKFRSSFLKLLREYFSLKKNFIKINRHNMKNYNRMMILLKDVLITKYRLELEERLASSDRFEGNVYVEISFARFVLLLNRRERLQGCSKSLEIQNSRRRLIIVFVQLSCNYAACAYTGDVYLLYCVNRSW